MFFKLNELEKWKRNRLVWSLIAYMVLCIVFLGLTCSYLYNDHQAQRADWKAELNENSNLLRYVKKIGRDNNTPVVKTGTYVENIKNIDLKNNSLSMTMVVWFLWHGHNSMDIANNFRVYKADIESLQMVDDYHKGNTNYQKVRVNLNVTKNYRTPRFPLESHHLRIYIEPNARCDQVILSADRKNSGLNKNLEVSGYKVTKNDVAIVPIEYSNTQSDPVLDNLKKDSSYSDVNVITTEMMTCMEIVRDGWGTYIKCFIALFATLIWVLIMLYLATVHEVDPLGMIPGAFFGAVSNILVGANLLPDELETGLVEFVNIWGIYNILACTVMIISINSIRKRFDSRGFAKLYGRIMFSVTVCMTFIGNLILPLACVL